VESTALWVVIALVLIAALVWVTFSRRRRQQLRERFGPEYDRTLRDQGSIRKAEAELEKRAQRVDALHIRPLDPSDAARFDTSWRAVQARFVDDPRGAVTEADRLVGEVMTARGYPVGDFEQRVADISVDHAPVVMNYRAARDIAVLHAQGRASTEDLRQAMVHYRALFRDLLETRDATPHEVHDHHEHAAARGRRG
jgi:hypothetical protein